MKTINNLEGFGPAGFNDDRVIIQGFYWESYRHGHEKFENSYGSKRWYDIVAEQAQTLNEARFDLIWLPPPFYAGQHSAGYNPKEYFNFNNSYGNFDQHRRMLETLLNNGVEPMADVVINHRDGTTRWEDFKNPTWGTWSIQEDDEAFRDKRSSVYGLLYHKRGLPELPTEYRPVTYSYGDFRDIDHTCHIVRRDVIKALLSLRSLGYRGWRYDMIHGFPARYIRLYNKMSMPSFSVGEYDWDKQAEKRGWVFYTSIEGGTVETSSNVFDFNTFFTLKNRQGAYRDLYYPFGLTTDSTDNIPWKNRAVTFAENHDTGYRTNEDLTPQENHQFDSFQNGWPIEQAYAYLLTHPGIPCVFWKHYFDWGQDLQMKIKALINARKVAGVNAGSTVYFHENARFAGVYGAQVDGSNTSLFVRIGGQDNDWNPTMSGFNSIREYARGQEWCVWIGQENPNEFINAPLKEALPIPDFQQPTSIVVEEEQLY
ncbi:MAG: alpha-amylase family glycosyl hydrolase [Bacteroidota bacterium]